MNRAVHDWIAALNWVQDNVAAFGGDPGQVTIAGQSAGGVACATLLTAPEACGLFHRAICMSGAVPPPLDESSAHALTRAVADQVGVTPALEELAAVDPDRLVAAQEPAEQALARATPPQEARFFPSIDDELVPADPFDVIARGRGADVPLLLGFTAAEADNLAATQARAIDDEKVDRRLQRLGLDEARIASWRAANDGAEPWQILGRAPHRVDVPGPGAAARRCVGPRPTADLDVLVRLAGSRLRGRPLPRRAVRVRRPRRARG